MDETDGDLERTLRERAYFIWQSEGCPAGRSDEHWGRALAEQTRGARPFRSLADEEQAVIEGDASANFPAVLTKDVRGG